MTKFGRADAVSRRRDQRKCKIGAEAGWSSPDKEPKICYEGGADASKRLGANQDNGLRF
jgi:hypothetical protein